MKKIFITSTGTEIGKTLVTCAILNLMNSGGETKAIAIKPVISGFDFSETPNDIYHLCKYQNIDYSQQNLSSIFCDSFSEPLSPDMAAERESREPFSVQKSLNYVERIITSKRLDNPKAEVLLIEGIGGLYVPFNNTETTLDLIKESADEVILVVGSYLGSLSHTLSAYNNLISNGVKISCLIITENLDVDDEYYISTSDTEKSLENFISERIICLPRFFGDYDRVVNQVTETLRDNDF